MRMLDSIVFQIEKEKRRAQQSKSGGESDNEIRTNNIG